jgi:bacterioferritin
MGNSNSVMPLGTSVRFPSTSHTTIEDQKMSTQHSDRGQAPEITRTVLVDLLNEDLAGEYQAIISYVVYSQVLKGAQYMTIAAELEKHAAEELQHALIIAGQIDYLGGMPVVSPKPVKTSATAEDMLRFDLENENETVRRYRDRVRQCEALGEFAVAEHIRDILVQEQDHQIALATALGVETPDVTRPGSGKADKSTARVGARRNGAVATTS